MWLSHHVRPVPSSVTYQMPWQRSKGGSPRYTMEYSSVFFIKLRSDLSLLNMNRLIVGLRQTSKAGCNWYPATDRSKPFFEISRIRKRRKVQEIDNHSDNTAQNDTSEIQTSLSDIRSIKARGYEGDYFKE